MSTYSPKPGDITRSWHVIDANDVVLGRLAVTAATLLRGKHKPTYAPHMDGGDFVVVVNASKIALTGNKRTDKLARRHSGRPGGLKSVPYGELLDRDPRKAVELAVWGMLPEEQAQPEADQKAQGVRRSRAPAQRSAAEAVPVHSDRPVASTNHLQVGRKARNHRSDRHRH